MTQPEPIEFEGIVNAGLGEGARFTAIDWVGAALRRATGFDPWPGTLNLRLDETAQRAWQRAQHLYPGIVIDPAPGFCPASLPAFAINAKGRPGGTPFFQIGLPSGFHNVVARRVIV